MPNNEERLATMLNEGQTEATRFKNTVDARMALSYNTLYEAGFAMWYFALIGSLLEDADYCEFAVEGVDQWVALEEARMVNYVPGDVASGPHVAYDVYLEVGPIIADVMLVYDWCYDFVSSSQRTRWVAYAEQSVSNVWDPDNATWNGKAAAWNGWSIDNPSNNYYYSFLRATMLLGLATYGEGYTSAMDWIDHFRYTKIQDQLVPTFNQNLVGGGSREGSGYGTAMFRLFEVYDFWEGSTGEDIASLTDHTRASLLHFFHITLPTLDGVSLVGDHSRDETAAYHEYHRDYVQKLAYLLREDPIAQRARWYLQNTSIPVMGPSYSFMFVYDFLYADDDIPLQTLDALNTNYYGSGTGQIYMRSGWDTHATWVNFIAGPYTESHAHRDQGSFLLYKDEWLAYDANYHSMSGLSQEEIHHNLVRIDSTATNPPFRQWEGAVATLQALVEGGDWVHVAMDATPVYEYSDRDTEDSVSKVEREMVYLKPDCLVIFDRVNSNPAITQQTWQLNSPFQPSISGTHSTFTGDVNTLHVERLLPETGVATSVLDWLTVVNPDLPPDDPYYHLFTGGYRLNEEVAGGDNLFLHVVWVNNAVTSVTRSDSGGRIGVIVQLSDGRTATVRFSQTTVNGTLEITGAGSNTSVLLDAGVETLPELSP